MTPVRSEARGQRKGRQTQREVRGRERGGDGGGAERERGHEEDVSQGAAAQGLCEFSGGFLAKWSEHDG